MVHLTTALDAASDVPLYEQLYRSLAAEMRTGAVPAGTRMPGKRRLAAELSVSVNTVDAAYQMLAAEGYLEARERSGFYVQEYLALPESAAPAAQNSSRRSSRFSSRSSRYPHRTLAPPPPPAADAEAVAATGKEAAD